MLHTNTQKERYDIYINLWIKGKFKQERKIFSIEAASIEEINTIVPTHVRSVINGRDDVTGYEVIVKKAGD